jgi:hypothetical protein
MTLQLQSWDRTGVTRPPRDESAVVRLWVPWELQAEAHHFAYALRAMLEPLGLTPKAQIQNDPACPLEIQWPDGTERLPIDPARLREAFAAISGLREQPVPKDHLGRTTLRAMGLDCRKPDLGHWAADIASSLAGMNPQWRRPEPRFTVFLTHDVEPLTLLEPVDLAGKLIRLAKSTIRRDWRTVREVWRWLSRPGRLVKTYRDLAELEQSMGAVATYFFMCGRYDLRRYGCRSVWPVGRLRRLVGLAQRHGHRVGLHGSAYGIQDDDYDRRIESLAELAGAPVTWYRNHYLAWDAAQSPPTLFRSGLRVDSTCGFNDGAGFRAGLPWTYELWDIQGDRPSGVMEIPLIFMDAGHDLSLDKTWDDLRRMLEEVESVGGAVAVLFHPGLFVGSRQYVLRYKGLMEWLTARGADLAGHCDEMSDPRHAEDA